MLKRDVFSKDEFKQMGKYFVFVHIDTDQQPAVSSNWGVRALPTIKFLKADASLIHEFLGYRPLPQFLQEMDKARQMGGK